MQERHRNVSQNRYRNEIDYGVEGQSWKARETDVDEAECKEKRIRGGEGGKREVSLGMIGLESSYGDGKKTENRN